jgi:succinoglycan biosynthesis transport protein ExoP
MNKKNPSLEQEQKSDPTLRDLLTPLFRHKRTFIITFAGTMLGGVLAAILLSSTYEASMEILVNEERADPLLTSEATVQAPTLPKAVTDEDVASEVELLQSPDLLQEVVVATGLQDLERKSLFSGVFRKHDDAWYLSKATKRLGNKLKIAQVSKTNLIGVSYKSSDSQLAYNVLQKLSTAYLAKHLSVHRPPGTSAFFSSQAQKYRKALEDSEARLAAFGKETGVVAPDVERTEMAQQVVNMVAALESAQRTATADKQRIEDEQARMKATPERSKTQQTVEPAQTLLQQLKADLLAAELKKTQLLLKYDPSYPLVQEAQQEIVQTQAAIAEADKQHYVNETTDRDPTYQLMKEDVTKTQADLAFQQAAARALQTNIRNMRGHMLDLDQKALRQADLNREVRANESNYLLYLSKQEQERTSDALDEKRIGNVAIAIPPTVPILPWVSPILVLLIAAVFAMFLGTGAAFVREHLDPSLRTPNEVVEILRIPVLASVPKQSA